MEMAEEEGTCPSTTMWIFSCVKWKRAWRPSNFSECSAVPLTGPMRLCTSILVQVAWRVKLTSMLFRMYLRWSDSQQFKAEIRANHR